MLTSKNVNGTPNMSPIKMFTRTKETQSRISLHHKGLVLPFHSLETLISYNMGKTLIAVSTTMEMIHTCPTAVLPEPPSNPSCNSRSDWKMDPLGLSDVHSSIRMFRLFVCVCVCVCVCIYMTPPPPPPPPPVCVCVCVYIYIYIYIYKKKKKKKI